MNELYELVSFTESTIVEEMVGVESKVIRMFSGLKSIVVDAEPAMIGLTRVDGLVVKAILGHLGSSDPPDNIVDPELCGSSSEL